MLSAPRVTSAEIDQNNLDVNTQCEASVRVFKGPSGSREGQLCDAMAPVPKATDDRLQSTRALSPILYHRAWEAQA